MANTPGGFMPLTRMERLVNGLRDSEMPSEVRVYNANTGELLRIVQPKIKRPRGMKKREG